MIENKRNCGSCIHFQSDGMFGIWCDINDTDYLHFDGEADCPNFKGKENKCNNCMYWNCDNGFCKVKMIITSRNEVCKHHCR